MRESVLPAVVVVAGWFRGEGEGFRFRSSPRRINQDTGECFNLSQQYIPPAKADHRLTA
jgi:hypothetical protein